MIKYPDDRIDGHVLLTCEGKPFVTKFSDASYESYVSHWIAWRTLLKRYFGEQYEPNALSNIKNHY